MIRWFKCVACGAQFDYDPLEPGLADKPVRDETGGEWCQQCAGVVLAAHRIGRHPARLLVDVREAVVRWFRMVPLGR